MVLQWLDMYKSGIIELDLQHKNIINIINGIYHYFKINQYKLSEWDFKNLLKYLIQEYNLHFKTEEEYFKILCYPERDSHIEEHRLIQASLNSYLNKATNKEKINIEVFLNYVNNWLFDHLNLVDIKFIDWYRKSGVKINE